MGAVTPRLLTGSLQRKPPAPPQVSQSPVHAGRGLFLLGADIHTGLSEKTTDVYKDPYIPNVGKILHSLATDLYG